MIETLVLIARLCMLVYGIILAAAGVYGWWKEESTMSLWAGIATGTFLCFLPGSTFSLNDDLFALGVYFLLAFIMSWIPVVAPVGFVMALLGALALLVFFGFRWYVTETIFPTAVLAIISVLAGTVHLRFLTPWLNSVISVIYFTIVSVLSLTSLAPSPPCS